MFVCYTVVFIQRLWRIFKSIRDSRQGLLFMYWEKVEKIRLANLRADIAKTKERNEKILREERIVNSKRKRAEVDVVRIVAKRQRYALPPIFPIPMLVLLKIVKFIEMKVANAGLLVQAHSQTSNYRMAS